MREVRVALKEPFRISSSTRQDVRHVRAVREAVGHDIGLMADANSASLPTEVFSARA